MNAVRVLRHAAQVAPKAPLVLSNLGTAYAMGGDLERGKAALEASLAPGGRIDVPEPRISATPWDYITADVPNIHAAVLEMIALSARLSERADAVGHDGVHDIPGGGPTGKQMALLSSIQTGGPTRYWVSYEGPWREMLNLQKQYLHDSMGQVELKYSNDVAGIKERNEQRVNGISESIKDCEGNNACILQHCQDIIETSQQSFDASKSAY